MEIRRGQLITVPFEGKEFQAIVVDPNGLGPSQPSIGFGFNMMEKHAGIPQSTLSTWVHRENEENWLKLPSGKLLRYIEILGENSATPYNVIEASDWFELAFDLLENPGKTSKSLKSKLLSFIKWFTIKGFYAEAYVALKGSYTAKDSRATTKWLEARQLGKIDRKHYTDLLQAQGCKEYDYGNWTNYIYQGLFGLTAKQMKEIWDLVDGNPDIARNYIPEARGLEAVRHCEDMTIRLFIDDLEEAHDQAINLTRRKFIGGA